MQLDVVTAVLSLWRQQRGLDSAPIGLWPRACLLGTVVKSYLECAQNLWQAGTHSSGKAVEKGLGAQLCAL